MRSELLLEMHEVLGNMSEAWHLAADDLLLASQILHDYTTPSDPKMIKIGEVADELATLPPELMLRGLALEAYFKAIWTKRGHKLVKKPKFVGVPGAGQHDLLQLAQVLALDLSSAQRDLLVRLSRYIEYAGRYPIPKRAERLQPDLKKLGSLGAQWQCPQDDEMFDSILAIVSKELG